MKPAQHSEQPRTTPDPTILEEQIRLRAYALYEARGREDGHDREHWLQAEAEILDRETAPTIEEPADTATRHTELLAQEDTAA